MARRTRVLAPIFAGLMVLASAWPIAAEESVQVELSLPMGQVFVGGQVDWWINAWYPGTGPASAVFHWGDGSPDTAVTWSEPSPGYCPAASPCMGWGSHVYTKQGIFTVTVTATQAGAADGTAKLASAVIDLAKGGSVKGSGTVYAPAGSGGQYDLDFAGGPATFKLEASRRAGTSTTTATLTVSVPSMTPEHPATTGMTFRSTSPLETLYVKRTNAGGEAFLGRMYGTVTNSRGSAGTAYAMIHVRIINRTMTLVRIAVWNTGAGYTYVDTGFAAWPGLDPLKDLLTSGSLKIY